ncbi:MAG: enoyl-CoA hydratase [Streptosporangiaceae bacterium]|nr:enoyl-CoA hydratase [Streptosporangiaceae bacterium]
MSELPEQPAPTVAVSREEGLAIVSLTRPPDNRIDEELAVWLWECLDGLDHDPDVGAIVLTGTGEVFCAGADAAAVRASGRPEQFADAIARLFAFFPASSTPLVAAVNGDALAGGFGLVCSCDVVIVADGARLGTNEAAFGAWPVLAQVPIARRVPEKAAITNALTGEPFTARQALALGIVDEVVAARDLSQRARHWGRAVSVSGSAAAVGRPLFYRSREQTFEEALGEARRALARAFGAD